MKNESIENREIIPRWVRPNFNNEMGEIKRAAREFFPNDPKEESIEIIVKLLNNAPLVELTDNEWELLENTDFSQHQIRAC